MVVGKKMLALVDAFRAEVEKEIAFAEKKSSIEFVAHISERSGEYRSWFWLCLLIPAIIDYFLVNEFWGRIPNTVHYGISIAFMVWMLGVIFFEWHFCLVPSKEKHSKVVNRAKLAFLEHQVFATKKRTGILIYISLLEKSVFVLADRGFDQHVKPEEWSKLGIGLASDFCHKNPGKTFIQALHALVERLAPEFPLEAGDSNELKDDIRLN